MIYVFEGESRERFLCDLKLLGIIWKIYGNFQLEHEHPTPPPKRINERNDISRKVLQSSNKFGWNIKPFQKSFCCISDDTPNNYEDYVKILRSM